MATYLFYADAPHKRRADGINTAVAQGASASAARVVAELLIGQPGCLADFAAVDLASAPPFVLQGAPPVGGASQSVWNSVTRGGNRLGGS